MTPRNLWAKSYTWKATVDDGWSGWNAMQDEFKEARRKLRRQVLRKLTYEERVANVLSDGVVLEDKLEDAIAAQIG